MEISKEHPYEDTCKILSIRPVANYKSYQLTDETRNFIKLETVGAGAIQIIENLRAYSFCILSVGLVILVVLSVLPWNSKMQKQQKNLQDYVNL